MHSLKPEKNVITQTDTFTQRLNRFTYTALYHGHLKKKQSKNAFLFIFYDVCPLHFAHKIKKQSLSQYVLAWLHSEDYDHYFVFCVGHFEKLQNEIG